MKILGVAFLSDASAAVLIDGKLVSAISEERINRIKNWNGVPKKAIDMALKLAGLTLEDIDCIATHGACDPKRDSTAFENAKLRIEKSDLPKALKEEQLQHLQTRLDHENSVVSSRTPKYLDEIRALGKPVITFGHHQCHAASAYYASGWKNCGVMTADGWGEDGSSTVYDCHAGKMDRKGQTPSIDSLGYFYGSITKALGFIPHRHEGKILGLAAYCQNPKSYNTIRGMVDYDSNKKQFIARMEGGFYVPRFQNDRLKEFSAKHKREDVCAAAQKTLEEVVTQSVSDWGGITKKLALAGGIFANVKLNQRLAELESVDEIFVFPNMGDGGLSVGAAYLAYFGNTGLMPEALTTMLLGPQYSEQEIGTVLAASGLRYERHGNITEKIAELLSQNEVVARFSGKMEFGPRALGSRSILYPAREPSVNDWLNQRLKRSEFMPFAPATLESHASECYIGLEKVRHAAKYMTTTVDCTAKMKADAPAAVHIDGTARPQVISKQDYPDFHSILTYFHKRSQSPTLINTSFNMHEEPIVCTPEDALRAILDGELPYLAIGDFLVSNPAK